MKPPLAVRIYDPYSDRKRGSSQGWRGYWAQCEILAVWCSSQSRDSRKVAKAQRNSRRKRNFQTTPTCAFPSLCAFASLRAIVLCSSLRLTHPLYFDDRTSPRPGHLPEQRPKQCAGIAQEESDWLQGETSRCVRRQGERSYLLFRSNVSGSSPPIVAVSPEVSGLVYFVGILT
jgi:hypothetical protein